MSRVKSIEIERMNSDEGKAKPCTSKLSKISSFSYRSTKNNDNFRRNSVCCHGVSNDSNNNLSFSEWLFSLHTATVFENGIDNKHILPEANKRAKQCFIEPFCGSITSKKNLVTIKNASAPYADNFLNVTHGVSMPLTSEICNKLHQGKNINNNKTAPQADKNNIDNVLYESSSLNANVESSKNAQELNVSVVHNNKDNTFEQNYSECLISQAACSDNVAKKNSFNSISLKKKLKPFNDKKFNCISSNVRSIKTDLSTLKKNSSENVNASRVQQEEAKHQCPFKNLDTMTNLDKDPSAVSNNTTQASDFKKNRQLPNTANLPSPFMIKEKYTLVNGSLRNCPIKRLSSLHLKNPEFSHVSAAISSIETVKSNSNIYYNPKSTTNDVYEIQNASNSNTDHSVVSTRKPLKLVTHTLSSQINDTTRFAQTKPFQHEKTQNYPAHLRLPTRSMTTAAYRQNVGEWSHSFPYLSYTKNLGSTSKYLIRKENEISKNNRNSIGVNRLANVNSAISAINRRFSFESCFNTSNQLTKVAESNVFPNASLNVSPEPHFELRQQLENTKKNQNNICLVDSVKHDNILPAEKIPFAKRVKHAFSLAVSIPSALHRQFYQNRKKFNDYNELIKWNEHSDALTGNNRVLSNSKTTQRTVTQQVNKSSQPAKESWFSRQFVICNGKDSSFEEQNKAYSPDSVHMQALSMSSQAIDEDFSLEQSVDKSHADGNKDSLKTVVALVSLKGVKPLSYSQQHHRSVAANLNQDRAFIQSLQSNVTAFAVFDGHGEYGHDAAQFVADQFREILITELGGNDSLVEPLQSEKHLLHWMRNSFRRIDKKLIKCHPVPFNLAYSGTTGSVAVRVNNAIYVGYVGDSKVVGYCFQGSTAVKVMETPEHNPVSVGESQRIRKTGGRISEVFFQHLNKTVSRIVEAGISVSRSFGDLQARQFGLICEPELVKFDIEPQPTFLKQKLYPMILVVASDGLWDTLSAQEVLHFFDNQRCSKDVLMASLKKMILASWKKRLSLEGRSDDTTAILALISPSIKTAFQEA